MRELDRADALDASRDRRFAMSGIFDDFPVIPIKQHMDGYVMASFGRQDLCCSDRSTKIIERCILMTTDPGDLVLDPTCGSGTTAYVAEQWGRRWITIDTSRVALALARARIMGARYPYYLLADSPEGQRRRARSPARRRSETPTHGDIRHGFVYERVPHITLKSIANNAEIDVIWEKWQADAGAACAPKLNAALGKTLGGMGDPARGRCQTGRKTAKKLHAEWWQARIARQKEIDASIAAKAEFEYLYDKPYPDNSRIRVAGPFTVESLSPHPYRRWRRGRQPDPRTRRGRRRLGGFRGRWCSKT